MSDTLDKVQDRTEFAVDEGDAERFSHYVRKEEIARAAVEGIPATAICGKQWVPVKDPERFPVCPTCKEIYESFKE